MSIYKLLEESYLAERTKRSSKQELYYIEIDGGTGGFFALLRVAMDWCCYADENGFRPYIKYGRNMLYAEKSVFLGTNNPFEYYFEQPAMSKHLLDLRKINVIKGQSIHMESIELKYNLKSFSYLMEESYVDRMSDIYRKYMQLNSRTSHIIDRSIGKILKGKRTLGIHIRGTDFYKEFHKHPVPVTVDEYIKMIKGEVEKWNYEQVFVATDDARCLEELKKKTKIPLVYYKNTMRTEENRSVAFQYNERKHNRYLLGLEVLRDAYTLAACKGFLGCLSQVDLFVQIIKRSRGQKFDSLAIINKGICQNNKQCWEPRN